MAHADVFRFFRDLETQPDTVHNLRTQSKQALLDHAAKADYTFSEREFDEAVWGLEIFLAGKLGEPFDFNYSLWETMWGNYYLEFLVKHSVGAASEKDIAAFLKEQT